MKKAPASQAAPRKPLVVWPTARRPAWISDDELEWLPDDARQEAVELIAATYQELVVEAETALERAAGEEFVFLFWLGLLRSLRLRGHSRWVPGQALLLGSNPQTEVQDYLQLGLARQRVTNLLLRIKEWQARWRRDGERQAVVVRNATSATEPATARPAGARSSTVNDTQADHSGPGGSNGQPGNVPSPGERQAGVMAKSETDAPKDGGLENGIGPRPSVSRGEGASRLHASEGDGAVRSDCVTSEGSAPHTAAFSDGEPGLKGFSPDSGREGQSEKPKSEGQNEDGVLTPLPATV